MSYKRQSFEKCLTEKEFLQAPEFGKEYPLDRKSYQRQHLEKYLTWEEILQAPDFENYLT